MNKGYLLFAVCLCASAMRAKDLRGAGGDHPRRNVGHAIARSLLPAFEHVAAEELLRGQQLRAAAQEGDFLAARQLLNQGVRAAVVDQALTDALEAGHADIAVLLINRGARPEVNDFLAMRMAVQRNQVAVLNAMLAVVGHAPGIMDMLLEQAFGQSPIAGVDMRTLILSFESTLAGRDAALHAFVHSALLFEDDMLILPALGQLLAAGVSADAAHRASEFAAANGYALVADRLAQYH